MTLRQTHSRRLGHNKYVITILCLYLFICTIRQTSQANEIQLAEQEICYFIDPISFAPEQISRQIENARRLYKINKFQESAREFQILFQQYPSCWFLFPVILSHVDQKDCVAISALYRLVPTNIGDNQNNEFSDALRKINKIVAQTCPHRASAGNRPATPSADSASSTEDPMKPQAKMNNPAPPVPNDHAPIPPALSARSSAVSERRPWYRKAWPWLTAAGVAVTAAGIGIGIGLGAGQGQGTGIPFSSLYDGPQAVPLARSVH